MSILSDFAASSAFNYDEQGAIIPVASRFGPTDPELSVQPVTAPITPKNGFNLG